MSQNIIHANYNNLNTYGTFEKLFATREYYKDDKDNDKKKTKWIYVVLLFIVMAIIAFYFFKIKSS
jgi:hypothetical protein